MERSNWFYWFFIFWFSFSMLSSYTLLNGIIGPLQLALLVIALLIFLFRVRNVYYVSIVFGLFILLLIQLCFSLSTYSSFKVIGLFIIASVILTFSTDFIYSVFSAYLNILLAFIIIILFFTLIIPILPNDATSWLGRIRYTFGFKNANFFSLYVFNAVILVFYLKKNILLKLSTIFLFLTVIYYTGTRTEIAFSMLFLLLFIFHSYVKVNIIYLYELIFVGCILLCIFVFVNEINSEYPLLDILLSFRLTLLQEFKAGLSTINYLIGGAGSADNQVDNSLASIFAGFGFPGFFSFIGFFIYSSLKYKDSPSVFSFLVASIFVFFIENLFSPFTFWGVLVVLLLLEKFGTIRRRY